MGVLLTNMLQFCYAKAKRTRSGTHWQVYGPVYYVAVANVLCMISPLAILFIYVGKVGYPGSKMWKGSDWFPNTVHGVLIYLTKWVGSVFLIVGVMQITKLHTKIRNRWRELRCGGSVHVETGYVAKDDAQSIDVQPAGEPPAKPCAAGD